MTDVEKDDLTDLQKALARHMDNIHKLLAAIADKSGALANDTNPDWGNAGSLGHAEEKLKDIAIFLGCAP
jgi:hypothetical protein